MTDMLSRQNHDRDVVGMTYVYPVVSRRAGGVSVGINLNPNNACNWHCVYCQVPNLTRGVAPDIDLERLRGELNDMLHAILHGDFMQARVPEACRSLCDVAISGNGEPTSCTSFDKVVGVVLAVMQRFDLLGVIPLRLISNGSYMHKVHVQRGLHLMAQNKGEVWVKVDAVRQATIARINGVKLNEEHVFKQVKTVAHICPSWIQTCMLSWQGAVPCEEDIQAYLAFLQRLKDERVAVQGVLLYGLARPSLQPEAKDIAPLGMDWMQALQERIKALGLTVSLSQ